MMSIHLLNNLCLLNHALVNFTHKKFVNYLLYYIFKVQQQYTQLLLFLSSNYVYGLNKISYSINHLKFMQREVQNCSAIRMVNGSRGMRSRAHP